MPTLRFLPALAVLASANLMTAAPAAAAGEPGISPIDPADHYLHPLKDSYYTEDWNYQLLSDSGQLVYLSYMVTNIGVFSGLAGVHVTLAGTGGASVFLKDEGSRSLYAEDRAKGEIRIGKNSMTLGDGTVTLHVEMERLAVDLVLKPWMPGFRIGWDKLPLDEAGKKFHWTLFEIPRADVKGTITLDGKAMPFTGACYMDHAVQTTTASDFSYRWYTLRAFYPDHTVALMKAYLTPREKKRDWTVAYVTDRKSVLGATGDWKITPSGSLGDPQGYKMPDRFGVEVKGAGWAIGGHYRSQGLLARSSILEQLSWAERQVVSLFAGNPIIYRFRSDAPLVLERGGEKIELRGPAFHEVVMLSDVEPP